VIREKSTRGAVVKKLIAALVALAVLAPAALASSSHFLTVSPSKVRRGKTVTISGSVAGGCQTGHQGDVAIIFSRAFKGATTHRFAGIPSISVSLARSIHGGFSTKLNISRKVNPGKYFVTGRCGGGNFGSTTLRIRRPPSGLPQGY
jgi:hypothetical protein